MEEEDKSIKNIQELQRLDAAVPVEPFIMEVRVRTIHERSCTRPALVKTTSDMYHLPKRAAH